MSKWQRYTLHPTLTSPVEYEGATSDGRAAAARMRELHGLGVACVAVEWLPGTTRVLAVHRTPEALEEASRRRERADLRRERQLREELCGTSDADRI